MKISASILAAKLTSLATELPTYKPENIDLIHIDVMDGNFVPQISFGEAFTKEVKSHTQIPLDVHLMVQNPELHVPKYFDLNPYCITSMWKLQIFRYGLQKRFVNKEFG